MATDTGLRPGSAARPEVHGGGASPPFALHPPRARKGLDPTRPGEFAGRLERFRRRHAALPDARLTGTLHLLDLEQIHLRFGRRWPELREKVFQILEHAVDRAIGPNDLYVVADEHTVFVLASGRRRSEARTHIELLASEITERLCGLVPGGVAVRCRSLPFDLVGGLEGVVGLKGLRERIERCEREVESAERRAFEEVRERLVVGFEPVLHPRKRLVAAHRIGAFAADATGRLEPADCHFEDRITGTFDALVDRWLLETCAGRLAASPAPRTTLVLPLRAETLLALATRKAYLAACRRLPLRSGRRLVFEILELPGAMPQARLREVVGYVAPFALGVAVRVHPRPLALDNLEGSGARFASLSCGPPPDGPQRAAPPPLAGFVTLAHGLRLRAVCTDIAGEGRLREALAAGVDYVAGPAIAPVRTTPLGRRRL